VLQSSAGESRAPWLRAASPRVCHTFPFNYLIKASEAQEVERRIGVFAMAKFCPTTFPRPPAATSSITAARSPSQPQQPAQNGLMFLRQFFRADTDEMKAFVTAWQCRKWVQRWDGRFGGDGDFFGVPANNAPVYAVLLLRFFCK
jgi:hypothetical protein